MAIPQPTHPPGRVPRRRIGTRIGPWLCHCADRAGTGRVGRVRLWPCGHAGYEISHP